MVQRSACRLGYQAEIPCVQFETLEAACMGYLSDQAQHMDAAGLLRLAQFADHLGLSPLLDTASAHLIALPWHPIISVLISLLKLPVYASDTGKCSLLLHGPRRGAYTELQVLAVLEGLSTPRAHCTPYIQLQNLQPAELAALITALLNSEEDPGQLLRAAAKQQQVPKALREASGWSKNIRITHKILLPAPGSRDQYYTLPQCKLRLCVGRRSIPDGEGQYPLCCATNLVKQLRECSTCDTHSCQLLCSCLSAGPEESLAVFVQPPQQVFLRDIMQYGILFALHPTRPYVACFYQLSSCQTTSAGHGRGFTDYLSQVQKLYAPDYPGPFTIGIWWQEPDRKVADWAESGCDACETPSGLAGILI